MTRRFSDTTRRLLGTGDWALTGDTRRDLLLATRLELLCWPNSLRTSRLVLSLVTRLLSKSTKS